MYGMCGWGHLFGCQDWREKMKWYAVLKGHRPGIYTEWEGVDGARKAVDGYRNAFHRGFTSEAAATSWLRDWAEREREALARPGAGDVRTARPEPDGRVLSLKRGTADREHGVCRKASLGLLFGVAFVGVTFYLAMQFSSPSNQSLLM